MENFSRSIAESAQVLRKERPAPINAKDRKRLMPAASRLHGPCVKFQDGTTIPFPAGAAWVLGRGTPDAMRIDIDLTPFGGQPEGVSRRHACIRQGAEGFTVEDLGSHNETCLNSDRLASGQQYPLAHGDQLRLGGLRCVFLIEK